MDFVLVGDVLSADQVDTLAAGCHEVVSEVMSLDETYR